MFCSLFLRNGRRENADAFVYPATALYQVVTIKNHCKVEVVTDSKVFPCAQIVDLILSTVERMLYTSQRCRYGVYEMIIGILQTHDTLRLHRRYRSLATYRRPRLQDTCTMVSSHTDTVFCYPFLVIRYDAPASTLIISASLGEVDRDLRSYTQFRLSAKARIGIRCIYSSVQS